MSRLHKFQGLRILVVGDVMLDEYLHGTVRRVSPEAPVPVVELDNTAHFPGGAANVAVNIAHLGGKPFLCGILGDDKHAEALELALRKHGITGEDLVRDAGRLTTTKTRVVASRHQIVRIDAESLSRPSAEAQDALLNNVARCLEYADACVLSDYGKGALSNLLCAFTIDRARAADKPVIVDPKTRDFAKYKNATVITPNLKEFCTAAVEQVRDAASLMEAAKQLGEHIGSAALLVTRGPQGMTLLEANQAPRHAHALAQQVFDVTGAGDTVVSTLALALATGVSLADAAYLSNIAAGLVVAKPGTASVSIEELNDAAAGHDLYQWHCDDDFMDYRSVDKYNSG